MNKLMKSEAEAVHDKLRPLEQYLQRLSERCQGELCARKAPMDDLSLLLNRLIDACDLWLQLHPEAERRDVILEIYFHLVSCRRIFELYDESFITWYENDAKGGFHLRLYCMNPARAHPGASLLWQGRHLFQRHAIAFAVSCHVAWRTRQGAPHRASFGLQRRAVCRDHSWRHFHALAASRRQRLSDRECHLSQHHPKKRQLHRLFPQLSLHGALCKALFQTLPRHHAACAKRSDDAAGETGVFFRALRPQISCKCISVCWAECSRGHRFQRGTAHRCHHRRCRSAHGSTLNPIL